MQRRRSEPHFFALSYAVASAALVCWAWYADIEFLHSEQEHMLPDALLMMATLPSSLTGIWFVEQWPRGFTGLVATAHLTACAALQSGFLFALSSRWRSRGKA